MALSTPAADQAEAEKLSDLAQENTVAAAIANELKNRLALAEETLAGRDDAIARLEQTQAEIRATVQAKDERIAGLSAELARKSVDYTAGPAELEGLRRHSLLLTQIDQARAKARLRKAEFERVDGENKSTVSDVILHLRYTARDGGSALKTCVESGLRELLNGMTLAANRSGLYQAYNLKQQFPNEWFQLKQSQTAQITLGTQYLPILEQNRSLDIDHVAWFARVDGNPATYVISFNAATSTLNRSPGLANLCVGESAAVVPGTPFVLSAADTSKLEELTMLIHYNLNS